MYSDLPPFFLGGGWRLSELYIVLWISEGFLNEMDKEYPVINVDLDVHHCRCHWFSHLFLLNRSIVKSQLYELYCL